MRAFDLRQLQGKRIYFDTNTLIYFVERISPYIHLIEPVFELLGEAKINAFTSEITLTETLIKPLRDKQPSLVHDYKDLLLDPDLFTLVPAHTPSFLMAAQIAAEHGLRVVDAIHMSAAQESGCHYFLGNDKKIKSYLGVEVICLSDFV